jgi:hypothetical protein
MLVHPLEYRCHDFRDAFHFMLYFDWTFCHQFKYFGLLEAPTAQSVMHLEIQVIGFHFSRCSIVLIIIYNNNRDQ